MGDGRLKIEDEGGKATGGGTPPRGTQRAVMLVRRSATLRGYGGPPLHGSLLPLDGGRGRQ
ncbi:MAG: hypothetical protein A2W09_00445 [Deltaproteobacteria bacterium RBG_16_50_11]|nr:MAG: hypothetical protein A2W09_00445 [Deltaproteobacteria bacterium RBG_16_50_11]